MQCSRTAKNMMSLLGGLGAGAAVMFLFDPKQGHKRRHYITRSAEDAWDSLRDKTGEYGSATAASLAALGTAVGRKKGDWSERAHDLGGYYKDRATGMGGDISARMHDWLDRSRARLGSWRGHEEEKADHGISFLGQTIAAVGFIAMGAGLMYIMDPAVGRRRRSLMRDKMASGMHQGQDYLSKSGQHLWNKASGTVAEVKGRLQGEDVKDDVLTERVRSQMDRNVSGAGSISVRASNGSVTLSGPILSSEINGLLKSVWQTPGVKEIVNELVAQEQMA